MNSIEIKYKLNLLGITFVDLDRKYKLSRGSCRMACSIPHPKGEVAISKALNIPAKDLFPDRYDELGNRLKPQPSKNYNYKIDSVRLNNKKAVKSDRKEAIL